MTVESSIGALTVTWNRRDDLLECVESLMRSSYLRPSVYVVDNASTDGAGDAVAERFPDVRLIRSDKNLGFAEGNNLGLARMLDDGVRWVFLVNNDVIVAQDAIRHLMEAGMGDPSIGALAPKVLVHSEPGVIWSAGGTVEPRSGIAVQRFYGETDEGQADEPTEIGYAVGCAMLVKSEAIRKVGLLDARYFMYYEEAEWCRRIRGAGYRILYMPESRVWHKVSLNGNGRNNEPYYMSRNRLLYLRSGGAGAGRVAWVAASDILRSAVAHAVRGRTHESRLMLRAVADYYSGNLREHGDSA